MTKLLVFLTALLLLPPAYAQAPRPDNIIVFGDSLSDTGNAFEATGRREPPSPPYFHGRFSNGPVWVEDFAAPFGLKVNPALRGGTNYAVGGAKVGTDLDSMKNQVLVFLVTRRIHSNDLFVVFGGGNDLQPGVTAGFVAATAMKVGDIVKNLATHGAAIFLVPNIPNKGLSPSAHSAGTTAEEQELTIAFNAAVDVILNNAATRLKVKIIRVDLFTLAQSVVTMPTPFGFTNVTDPCLVGTTVCSDPDSYLFWDDIHPTARAHQFIASASLAAFEAASMEVSQPVPAQPSFVESVVNEVRKFITGP